MNVVHIFPYPAGVPGGHANAIRGFIGCQRAVEINAVGVSPRLDAATEVPDWGFPIAEVGTLSMLRWANLAKQIGMTSENTLINLHSIDRVLRPLLDDLRLAAVPYVLTSHGQLGFQNGWHGLKKLIYLQLVNRAPGKAAGLQVLTSMAARKARRLLPAYRGKMLVQGNVLQMPDLAKVPAAARSEYGVPQDAFVVMFLGRLDVRIKGLDLAMQAFSQLPGSRARFVLAGPDWDGGRTRLEELARRLGCSERVYFPGPVYGERKWALLKMADVFISPSRREAFNIAQAEAMAVGLPVVTSVNVSLAEDLQAAKAALLLPLAAGPLTNAMVRLESDGALRRELGERGRDWVLRNCDSGTAGERFLSFYRSILGERGSERN